MKKLGILPAVRGILVATIVLAAGVAAAQVCPPPGCTLMCQATGLLAYETVPHNSPIFRVITDINGVDDQLTIVPPVDAPGAKVNYSVTIGTLPTLSFSAKTKQKKWTSNSHGDCFTIAVTGFEDPKGTTDITDFVGVHTINVNKPAFLCGDPMHAPLICFEDKEVSCVPAAGFPTCLPPGTDRNEDVCAVATVM